MGSSTIGFVGLGQMGRWMALNLLEAGHDLHVNETNRAALDFLTARGARAAQGLPELAAGCRTIFLSLPDTAVVQEVVFGRQGLFGHLAPGAVIVDLSTIGYLQSIAMAERLAAHGFSFCDAPVSGMEARAREGSLTIMFGGEERLFTRLSPLLNVIGSTVLYMGASGSGQLTKLINQLLFNISAAGIAEVLPMAAKLGLDPEKVSRVVATGTGRSFAAEFFMPLILDNRFDQGYPLQHAYKDMVSAAEIGAHHRIPLPLVQAAATTFQLALAQGLGGEDKGALIKVFERILNVAFRRQKPGTPSARCGSPENEAR
jgi:3-hydroxyisobutyrate dehydrogenase-like beta-hydroxyacid dehydrogenase